MAQPVILDEDTYTEAISLIIQRDFFPNLAKVKAQQAYLEAQKSGSLVDLQEAGKTLHTISTPKKDTTRDYDLGVNFYIEDEPQIEKRVNLNLSLDQFQTLYTSEDNASFAELLEKANVKVKQQNKWFFDRESSKQLCISDGSKKLIEANDKAPSGWKYKARNALMYFPEGKSESWVNEKEARGLPKSIEYQNTHIMAPDQISTVKSREAPSDIAARNGSLTPWSQMNGLNSNSLSLSSPGIRGYNLVDATPSLSPSHMGTPQMTWGSIEGTPMLISGNATPGPQFSLPQISKREELGMKLSEKASKAYRKKTNERQRTSAMTPRSGAGLMSPAAQHLLKKSSGTPLRAQSGFGQALRSSYGASPLGIQSPRSIGIRKRPGATPTPIALFRAGATPQQKKQ